MGSIMFGKLFGGGKRRILVADDDPSIAGLVSEILGALDFDVTVVHDGQAAVARVRAEKFDLLIMDVHMPKLEGPQALEVIRVLPNGKDLGVIMATSESATGTLSRVYELGIFGYITKPFSAGDLAAKVNAYFERKK